MAGWRDIKRQKSRDVHHHMLVPALYVVGATVTQINVRVHTKFAQAAVAGVESGFAPALDVTPRLVFARNEVALPERGAMVAIDAAEIYRVGESRPPDDEFITAEVAQLSPDSAAAQPYADWLAAVA